MDKIIESISNEDEYELALRELEKIFEYGPGTTEGKRAEVLSLLIGEYEDKHYPIPDID